MSQCGASEHENRCDRFDGHPDPHVRYTERGGTVAWNDPVPCKNCGNLIMRLPEDYLRRWVHVDFQDPSCGLAAAP